MGLAAVFTALLGRAFIGMRMRGLVVALGALLGVLVILARATLVMPERHALPRCDSGHALDWDGQGQQQDSKKSEESFGHRRAL